MKGYQILFLSLLLAAVLSACSLVPSGSASVPVEEAELVSGPTTEVVTSVPSSAAETSDLRPMPVEHVSVEVGIGSPIPVDIFVSGSWPDLCAQLARIDQKIEGFEIKVTMWAAAEEANCPPDFVGLPFRIAIPLNVVEMAEGTYNVTVNEAQTTFSVPVTPPAFEEPSPADSGGEGPLSSAGGLCPEIPRPAVAQTLPDGVILITDPASGASCTTSLGQDAVGPFRAVGDDLYFTVNDGEQLTVKRLAADGSSELLSFTAVDQDDAWHSHSFAVSPDGSRIAWAASGAGPDFSEQPESKMWVAGIDGSDVVMPLPPLVSSGEGISQALTPVRFSADNSVLYYTLQPVGLGGFWTNFMGRYNNLYALRLNTEAEPTVLFDCGTGQITLCIGDLHEVENQLANLAYVAGTSVVILNGAGDYVNIMNIERDYVGFPTFGPGGELIFFGADLADSAEAPPRPEVAGIYRIAPPTAPHELLLSDPALSLPQAWLDETHVVVSYYSDEADYWGIAVVGLDGSLNVLPSEPGASFLAVLGAN